ncbi:MAG: alginate export family protein [Arenimonas sp.]
MRAQGSDTSHRHRVGTTGGPWLWCLLLAGPVLAQADPDPPPAAADLRERLTEREDELRREDPFSVDFAGRPLFLSGQFELGYEAFNSGGDTDSARDERWLEPGLEAELFYGVSAKVAVFAQLRVAAEHNLRGDAAQQRSTGFVERGEMWLNLLDVAGSGLDLEIGRLDFEDDRTWWWDTDLDAVRLSREGRGYDIELAAMRELAPDRSDRDHVDVEHDGVRRLLLEASWDWAPNHALQLFALRHRDRSHGAVPGDRVARDREDPSDAQLTWLGLRASGAWASDGHGLLGYWIDAASVRGREDLAEYDDEDDESSRVADTAQLRVRGWAFDAGGTWIAPWAAEPRISVGFARGSGDPDPGDDEDRAFRQSGLHGNEIAFGGVQRFGRYGRWLDPELSNLSVATLGLGVSLLRSSSLDLVHHRYRLVEPAEALRDSRFDIPLTGDRDLGQAWDLVLALEEWKRLEFELSASAFKPGRAYGDAADGWRLGGSLAVRIAF